MSSSNLLPQNKHSATLKGLWVMLFAFSLTACSVLPKTEPVAYYRLPSQAPTSVPPLSTLDLTVRIKQPASSGLLASNRILVIPGDNQLSAYQGARWAKNVPVLFRDQVVDVWLQSARFKHVINDSQSLSADRELIGSLNSFQSEYINGQPSVVIQFDAQWIESKSRRLLASRRFSVNEPATSSELGAVVSAFGVAQAHLSEQLLAWALHITVMEQQEK